MKLKIFFFAFLAFFLAACSSHDGTSITSPGETVTGIKTCIRSSTNTALPGGTKAIRKSDSAVAAVDANGCYEFKSSTLASGFLARSVAETDSVQFYNDSALFAITLPYITAGDTVNVVPTIVTLQNVPNVEVDSAFLVAYDRVHMLSRKVRLRRADYGDTSSFSRTLWSRDDGQNVQVHFLTFGAKTVSSSIYFFEPGAVIYRNWNQINVGAVPAVLHGRGSYKWRINAIPEMGVIAHDSIMFSDPTSKIDTVVGIDVNTLSFSAKSIYGIRNNGSSALDITNIKNDTLVYLPVVVSDSAGISIYDTIRVLKTGMRLSPGNGVSTGPCTYIDSVVYIR